MSKGGNLDPQTFGLLQTTTPLLGGLGRRAVQAQSWIWNPFYRHLRLRSYKVLGPELLFGGMEVGCASETTTTLSSSTGARRGGPGGAAAQPLHKAAYHGHLAVVEHLTNVRCAAEVSAASMADGSTPLHAASYGGQLKLFTHLLSRKAEASAALFQDWRATPFRTISAGARRSRGRETTRPTSGTLASIGVLRTAAPSQETTLPGIHHQ